MAMVTDTLRCQFEPSQRVRACACVWNNGRRMRRLAGLRAVDLINNNWQVRVCACVCVRMETNQRQDGDLLIFQPVDLEQHRVCACVWHERVAEYDVWSASSCQLDAQHLAGVRVRVRVRVCVWGTTVIWRPGWPVLSILSHTGSVCACVRVRKEQRIAEFNLAGLAVDLEPHGRCVCVCVCA
jgi:hypothetical protein